MHRLQLFRVVLRDVRIAEAPDRITVRFLVAEVVRAVAATRNPPGNHRWRHGLTIVHPADSCKEVNETGRQVVRIVAELARLVVPWKDMVIVVPALSKCGQRNQQVVNRTDVPAYQ